MAPGGATAEPAAGGGAAATVARRGPPPPWQRQAVGAGAASGAKGNNGNALVDLAGNFARSSEFFARVAVIYGAYKAAQLRAAALRAAAGLQGADGERAAKAMWDAHHTWAGEQMYDLCISLRGFYLKAGQFIGARADFVPEQICRKLCLLQDQVPPMPADRARQVVCEELGISDLSEVFDWIDLDKPIGSASISQVHKARLRQFPRETLRRLARRGRGLFAELTVRPGDTAWSMCNSHGISLAELQQANRRVKLEALEPGQRLRVPVVLGLEHFGEGGGSSPGSGSSSSSGGSGGFLGLGRLLGTGPGGGSGGGLLDDSRRAGSSRSSDGWSGGGSSSSSDGSWLEPGASLASAGAGGPAEPHRRLLQLAAGGSGGGAGAHAPLGASSDGASSSDVGGGAAAAPPELRSPAAAAVAHALASGVAPPGGLVAVKVQYPGALATMTLDLVNLRSVSAFLQKTELKFDLLSAVEEMQRQIHLEFDFMREARVMDTIAHHLAPLSSRVAVPRSVPGLVGRRLMAMTFMEGLPMMQLRDRVAHMPRWKRERAGRTVLSRVSEAYGLMILGEGLFQADGHPGNILVQGGGRVALLDYGQSKQLGEAEKRAFAELILALNRDDKAAISSCLGSLGVSTSSNDAELRAEMARGMFDTQGKVDPFDKASPIKRAKIEHFPPDMFFVLRVVQLLRGMASGMGIEDFSTARQWAPLARQTLAKAAKRDRRRRQLAAARSQPLCDLAAIASPLRLTA